MNTKGKQSKINLFLSLFLAVTSAVAAPPQVTLTVTLQGNGTVASEPAGIICPTDCTESYKKSSRVTITATADPNSDFLGWDGACIGTQLTCTVKLAEPLHVVAIFTDIISDYPAPLVSTGQTRCFDDHRTASQEIPCSGTGHSADARIKSRRVT